MATGTLSGWQQKRPCTCAHVRALPRPRPATHRQPLPAQEYIFCRRSPATPTRSPPAVWRNATALKPSPPAS